MGKYKELEMTIQENYEKAIVDMNSFTTKTLKDMADKGVQVDPKSYTDHCHKVFLLGKIYALEEAINVLEGKKKETKATNKGTKNVTRKKASKKRNGRKSKAGTNDQLELGI